MEILESCPWIFFAMKEANLQSCNGKMRKKF